VIPFQRWRKEKQFPAKAQRRKGHPSIKALRSSFASPAPLRENLFFLCLCSPEKEERRNEKRGGRNQERGGEMLAAGVYAESVCESGEKV
jgi:hypothetical protein